jgi:hypothetical protein
LVELLNSDSFGVGKRKRGGEGIDGAAPTWERRGKRLVGDRRWLGAAADWETTTVMAAALA